MAAKTKINQLVSLTLEKFTLATVLFWSVIALFVALASEVLERQPIRTDVWILESIHRYANPTADRLVSLLTDAGSALAVIIIASVIMSYLAWRRQWRNLLLLGLIAVGAAGMNIVLKQLFQRTRPTLWQALVVEKSYSFPSGHAMASSALVFAVIAILWRTKWRWPAIIGGGVYAVIIGFSRLYLGVHFPSDILAAWCVSLAWALIVYRFLQPGTGVTRSIHTLWRKVFTQD